MDAIGNIMKPNHKRNLKFNDRIEKSSLIPISTIKSLFNLYDHSTIERYKQNILCHDVGCLFFSMCFALWLCFAL